MLSHLHIVHSVLKSHIRQGDLVVDATCGNGNDAKVLAKCALGSGGEVHCIDIQEDAIESTKATLGNSNNIYYHCQSHDTFPSFARAPSTIVYNLGYLPGGDKSITTLRASTYHSLENALSILKEGGLLAITFYPGHPEGRDEYENAHEFFSELPNIKLFLYRNVTSPDAPQVFFVKKTCDKFS